VRKDEPVRTGVVLFVLLAASTGCSGSSAGPLAASPGPDGGSSTPLPANACSSTVKQGAPVLEAQVVSGCTSNGKNVVLTTQRCKDGRTYLIYGTTFKGFVGKTWQEVGPAHAAAAAQFTSC
jgi:hypothetical protein